MNALLTPLTAVAALLMDGSALAQSPPTQPADLIVINAKVHTLDAEHPTATRMAICTRS